MGGHRCVGCEPVVQQEETTRRQNQKHPERLGVFHSVILLVIQQKWPGVTEEGLY